MVSDSTNSDLLDHLEDFEGEEIIIGGDFNLVLDVEKDKKRWPAQNTSQCAKNHL